MVCESRWGPGCCCRILLKELEAGIPALSSRSIVVFATGTFLDLRSFANSVMLCALDSDLAGPDYNCTLAGMGQLYEAVTGCTINKNDMLNW